jgi:hypothetical protein
MPNVKISELPAATTVGASDVLPIDQGSVTRKVRVDQLPGGGGGGGTPSDATPQPLGTASAGVSSLYSRGDHVHQKPTPADIGAAPTSHTHDAAAIVSGVLDNNRVNFAAPAAIGSTTPNTGAFSTISATGTATLPHIHGSIAGNFYIHVRNGSGSTMTRGTAVYIVGNVGNTDRVIVAPADRTNSSKMPVVGLLTQDLANNADGDAVIFGELSSADTSGYLLNQELFVGQSGALTSSKPTSGLIQSVGIVARVQQSNGIIVVNVQAQNPPIALPSSSNPQALGTAAAGTALGYSREDHVHPLPSAASIGLGNVDNTSDLNKPISTATQLALDSKVDDTQVGAANGVASLDSGGKLTTSQIPSIAITEYLGNVASESAMLALTGQQGDWCIRTDSGTTWVITGSTPSQLSSWTQLAYPAAPVTSVNGETGVVVIDKADIGLGNVANAAQVTSVAGTAPIVSSGGTTPSISINNATTSASGAMSAADKLKLDGIAAGAEVNVNADWNATTGDAEILNKPAIPQPSNVLAQPLSNNAFAGVSADFSRSDHIHPWPNAIQVGAIPQLPTYSNGTFASSGQTITIVAARYQFFTGAMSFSNGSATIALPSLNNAEGDLLNVQCAIGANCTLTITGSAVGPIVDSNTDPVSGTAFVTYEFIYRGGGWTRVNVINHTHVIATASTPGFMSIADKFRLDSIFPTVKNPTIFVRRFANFENSGFTGDTSNLNTLTNAQLNARGYFLLADEYFEWDPIQWAFPSNNFFITLYIQCGGIFNDGLRLHARRRSISTGGHVGFTGTMSNLHIQSGSSNNLVSCGGSGNANAWSGSAARERIEIWLAAYNGGNGGFLNDFIFKITNG